MKIINLMLVDNYITGKGKISEKRLEKLENDPDFMICAMNRSNDPKLYKLCSHDVKTNYNFIKYYINKFSNNLDAIDKAAKYFLENSQNEYINFELCILMKELTYQDDRLCWEYGIRVESISLIDDCTLSIITDDIKDENSKSVFGLGFMHIQDVYNESEIITDYYARRMLYNLFENNRKSIERELHLEYGTFEDFKKSGINKFIIDYVLRYDINLASYIQLKPELISSLNNVIESMSYRWYVYRKRLDGFKNHQILRVYDEYMKELDLDCIDYYYELLVYLVKKLDIPEEIFDFEDDLCVAEYEELLGYKNPVNISKYDPDKLIKLQDTIREIINSKDPFAIKNMHFPKERCVVSRIRTKQESGAKITQL